MPESSLSVFCDQFSNVCLAATSNKPSSAIKLANKLAAFTVECVSKEPQFHAGIITILSANKPLSKHHVIFCQTLILAVMALQNKNNTRATVGIIIGLILVHAVNENTPSKQKSCQKSFLSSLNRTHLTVASDILAINKLINSSALTHYLPYCRLTYWQWFAVWSVCLAGSETGQYSWVERILVIFQKSPQWTHLYLEPLLAFPSVCPPGSKFTSNGSTRICCAIDNKHAYFIDTDDELKSIEHKHVNVLNQVVESETWQYLSDRLALPPAFTPTFSVTRPPKSLLNVLRLLQNGNVDIAKLADAVENEPSFSNFIKQTASEGNRMSLPVVTVKQGIMTHGIERLGDMLVAHAMLNRFMQSDFPVRLSVADFVHNYMTLCAEIAAKTGVMLPQSASLVALIANSALFTHPSLKTISKWRNAESADTLSLQFDSLIRGCNQGTFTKAAITLAKAWHLSKRHINLIMKICATDTHNTQHKSVALFQIALLWSKHASLGINLYEPKLCHTEKNLLNILNLNLDDRLTIVENVSSQFICSLSKH